MEGGKNERSDGLQHPRSGPLFSLAVLLTLHFAAVWFSAGDFRKQPVQQWASVAKVYHVAVTSPGDPSPQQLSVSDHPQRRVSIIEINRSRRSIRTCVIDNSILSDGWMGCVPWIESIGVYFTSPSRDRGGELV